MISVNYRSRVLYKGRKTKLVDAFVKHHTDVVVGTTKEMNARFSPVEKALTSHIKQNLKSGNPRPIGTGRIMTADRLLKLNESKTKTIQTSSDGVKGMAEYTLDYIFPKNGRVEYGYPLGDKYTKLGYKGKDHLLRWLQSKNQYYGGIFYYKNRHGKRIEITKPYQYKSVVFAMLRGQKLERLGNVPNWYIVRDTDTLVSKTLKKYSENWYNNSYKKNFNKG